MTIVKVESKEPHRPVTRPAEPVQDAAYWKQKYEEERARLAKLWVAYRDVETELADLKAAKAASATPPTPPTPPQAAPRAAPEAA